MTEVSSLLLLFVRQPKQLLSVTSNFLKDDHQTPFLKIL